MTEQTRATTRYSVTNPTRLPFIYQGAEREIGVPLDKPHRGDNRETRRRRIVHRPQRKRVMSNGRREFPWSPWRIVGSLSSAVERGRWRRRGER